MCPGPHGSKKGDGVGFRPLTSPGNRNGLTRGCGGCALDSSLCDLQAAPSLAGTLRQAYCWEAHDCQWPTLTVGPPTALLTFLRLHSGVGCLRPTFPSCFSLRGCDSSTRVCGLSHTVPPPSSFSVVHSPAVGGAVPGPCLTQLGRWRPSPLGSSPVTMRQAWPPR